MDWRLAEAKNRFSELFTEVLTVGPQRVRRFKDAIIMISEPEYARLTGRQRSFKDHLLEGDSFEGLTFPRHSKRPSAGIGQ
jgi:hypothetical protein